MDRRSGLAAVLVVLASPLSVAASAQSRKKPGKKLPSKPAAKPGKRPAQAVKADSTAAIAQIEKAGGLVMPIAQNDDHLEVDFHMAGPSVTDAALAPLSALKGIVHLHLGKTGITDAGLAHVKGLTGLKELHLEMTRVTDHGLANLKGLKELAYLNLYGTGITDAGLAELSGLTGLKNLYVWQTKVTPAGVEALKKSLPKLEIVTGFDQPAPPSQAAQPAKPPEKK